MEEPDGIGIYSDELVNRNPVDGRLSLDALLLPIDDRSVERVDPALADEVLTPQSTIQDIDHVEDLLPSQRQIMPICSGSELAVCGEIERGFSEDMARAEASRCLQCGLICYDRSVQIEESVESEAVTS